MKLLDQVQKIALYLFFFSINFEMLVINDNFSVTKFSGILYILTVIPQIRYFFSIHNLKPVILPILLFYILLTINNLVNINELFDEVLNQSFILNLLVFLLMINHVRKDYLILEKGLISFVFGTFLLTLLFTLGIGTDYLGGRVTIFGDNQNGIGLKVSAALIVILVTIVQNRLELGWFRFLLLIPVPFMIRFMAATGSRVSVISFVLAFTIGVLLLKTESFRKKILMIIGGVVIIMAIAAQLMQSGILKERLTNSTETGDLGGRKEIWERIIPLIKDHPIIGVGNTGYDFYCISNFGIIKSPHNVILEVLCYTGLIGLLFYLAFLYQLFMRGYLNYLTHGWVLPILLISPVMGMIISGQILVAKMGWVIFAYLISGSAIQSKDHRII